MNIIHLTPSLSFQSGGPAVSIPNLSIGLKDLGCNVTILAGSKCDNAFSDISIKIFPFKKILKPLRIAPKMYKWLKNECCNNNVDILHSHNLWGMHSVYPQIIKSKYNKIHVISPRGTLSQYSMKSGSKYKNLYWRILQKNILLHCSGIHATAQSELLDIRRLGIQTPVAVIPNGLIFEQFVEVKRKKEFLFLGRIHPEKGLELLLKAWNNISLTREDWMLRIVGPDYDGYRTFLENYIRVNNISNVIFESARYGVDKYHLYRSASYFILPSYSENFGMSVAEALSMKLPVIANHGSPWSLLNSNNCGWWIDFGTDNLSETIMIAIRTPLYKREIMGNNGRLLVEKLFGNEQVSKKMLLFYEYLLGLQPLPSFVYL